METVSASFTSVYHLMCVYIKYISNLGVVYDKIKLQGQC